MRGLATEGTRAAVAALLAVTAGLIAWLISYWFWQISFRPVSAPTVVVELRPETLAQQVQAMHIFGRRDALPAPMTAVPATTRFALVGMVSAASGKKGVAVIVVDGKKAVTATIGEEIAPGLVLSAVARDHVELSQDGRTINLMLSTKK